MTPPSNSFRCRTPLVNRSPKWRLKSYFPQSVTNSWRFKKINLKRSFAVERQICPKQVVRSGNMILFVNTNNCLYLRCFILYTPSLYIPSLSLTLYTPSLFLFYYIHPYLFLFVSRLRVLIYR